MRRILVISPHIGDGEFGSGGTINRFAVEGNDIFHVIFSLAKKSMPERLQEGQLEKELYEAS